MRNPFLLPYTVLLLPSWFIAFLMYRSAPPFYWVPPHVYARYSRSAFNCVISVVLWTALVLIFWGVSSLF